MRKVQFDKVLLVQSWIAPAGQALSLLTTGEIDNAAAHLVATDDGGFYGPSRSPGTREQRHHARRCGMSVRTFSRAFRHETGTTPAAFVQASRVEAARRLIEVSDSTSSRDSRFRPRRDASPRLTNAPGNYN